jgi:hypothetical protein
MSRLELRMATGLFEAMVFASSRAELTTASIPPSTTFDTNPSFSASAAEKLRAV